MSAELQPDQIARHDELYFSDGNIALFSLPNDSAVVTAFKVDTAYLLRSSLVFKDMLSFPPPKVVDQYDDVPFVRLQDNAEDLSHFLLALYDPTTIPLPHDCLDSLQKIRSMLQLANKYQAAKLREQVVNILSRIWPRNASIAFETDRLASAYASSHEFFVEVIPYSQIPDPCPFIRLAHDCNVPEILPAAFYQLSRQSMLWDDHNAYSVLTKDDLLTLLMGKENICLAARRLCRRVSDKVRMSTVCESEDNDVCQEALGIFTDTCDLFLQGGDILDLLLALDDGHIPSPKNLCFCCKTMFMVTLWDRRSEFWNRVPECFELPGVKA